MTYTYTILTPSTYEITGTNYKSIFNGTSTDAALKVQELFDAEFGPLKDAKIKELQDKFQKEYSAYLARYPQSEVDSFADKKREALVYQVDKLASTPIIDAIVASMPNTTKAVYIAGVMAKIVYLAGREGAMVSIRDNIKACTTKAELDAIVI